MKNSITGLRRPLHGGTAVAGLIGLFASALVPAAAEPEPALRPPLPPMLPVAIPSFPGAWGGGMFTTGGRGGQVIAVTNLDDSGEGSLRAAIETEGPRIVIFRVAGLIELESDLDIRHPDITIAGQSAPGDGICISGRSLNIETRNVILRHLRVRGHAEGGQGSDNIGGQSPGPDIIVDHCSTSWGRDENISLYRRMESRPDLPPVLGGVRQLKHPAKNLTIQYTISSEAVGGGHEFGGTWGGEDATFHHNLFACNTGRNPSIGMSETFDYRNNVVFNWRHRIMDGGDETSMVNVINNYYRPGPATNDDMRDVIARIEQRNLLSPGKRDGIDRVNNWYPASGKRPGKWYVAGNLFHDNPELTADNWKGMKLDPGSGTLEQARVLTPFVGWPLNQQSAPEAFEEVLKRAGATLPRRDPVDTRVVKMVRSGEVTFGEGIVSNPEQVGGYPEYAFSPDEVPADGDGDGMPDAWEEEHGLDAGSAAEPGLDSDGDGYTDIEEWLNGTDPREKVDYLDLNHNIDTIS